MSPGVIRRMMLRTLSPYIGQRVIMLGVALLALAMTAKSLDLRFLKAVLTIAMLFAVIVYFGLRRASGRPL